jgi:D-beta-D-heptose 7-phosphate kinase/D-beta-D-heptose 1-phosphate adenosyltransferase
MFADPNAVRHAVLHNARSKKVLVVGDLMLDRYLSGPCERISPEAPVPVVRLLKRSVNLGGASNVAHNLARIGVRACIAGVVGTDSNATEMTHQHTQAGVTELCLPLERFTTIVKTRILAGDHQLVRLDEEGSPPLTPAEADDFLERLATRLKDFDAVVLSDYAKGVCTPYFCQQFIQLCRGAKVPVYVDPKGTNYRKYAGATAVKPNQSEMLLLAQTEGWNSNDIISCARSLQELLGLEFVALTLGAKGIALVEPDNVTQFPTVAKEVFDVSGAGDAVIAAMTTGLCCGLGLPDSVMLGNVAAGLVTAKLGCVPVERGELIAEIQSYNRKRGAAKHYPLEDLLVFVDTFRAKGQKIGLTNGCFDVIHSAHVRLLEEAAANCDKLIVAINSDRTVSEIKGSGRPFLNVEQRVEILSALECVDAVVVFDDVSVLSTVQTILPDVLVKGGGIQKDHIVGADVVASRGGQVLSLIIDESFQP